MARDSLPKRASRRRTSVSVDRAHSSSAVSLQEAALQRIADVRRHLLICKESLRDLETSFESGDGKIGLEMAGVSPITIRTLAACLSELLKLEWAQPHRSSCHDLCKLLDCPQQPVLRQAVVHTIEVLESTKFRFKSKELKRLREDLETLLGNSADFRMPSKA